jgi:DNA-binding PadR family transcriptional regulator
MTSSLDSANLARACNEALVLACLRDGPMHGYQIATHIAESGDGYFHFKHGTLYPILHRLEKDGLIKGRWSDEGPRGRRKSYALTRKGEGYARHQREAWAEFIRRFTEVVALEER